MRRTFRKDCALGIAALALGLISTPASAWCDFITGGGFIITTAEGRHAPAMANFGAHGGCKKSGPDAPFWGHVNYVDHGFSPGPGHFRSLTITAYFSNETRGSEKDPKRKGTRTICGIGTTNIGPALVDFRVEMTDNGEPGTSDIFRIRLGVGGMPIYSTFGDDGTLKGGNIQLHKPNPSNPNNFGGNCEI